MATAAEVKAAYGVTARGRPGRQIVEAWNAEHPDDLYGEAAPRGAPAGPDDVIDDIDGLFPGDMGDTGEQPPGRVRNRGGARKPASGFAGLFGKAGKGGKKPGRVSTEGLIAGAWRTAAKLLAPLPPLQRTLRIQAPVAGILLEPAVKDTIADALLQPFARLATAGRTLNALAGPPLWVTAISVHAQQRAQLDPPQDPHPLFMSMAEEGLRSSLLAWCEVSGPAFTKALQREAEFEEKYGGTVDDMMRFIFAPPVNPADEAAIRAEEEAIRRAQGTL